MPGCARLVSPRNLVGLALFTIIVLALSSLNLFDQRPPASQITPAKKPVFPPQHVTSDPDTSNHGAPAANGLPPEYTPSGTSGHPIDYLIKTAEINFNKIRKKQTHTLAEAAQAYRERRGRHPPPGFEKWWAYASERGGIIVEDFFDQIYADINPFWGIEPKKIRQLAYQFETTVNVRDGIATMKTDTERPWMNLWFDMTKQIEQWLPDVDIPINVMDESRVIVPWGKVQKYVQAERDSRKLVPKHKVVTSFTGLNGQEAEYRETIDTTWHGPSYGSFWDIARVACGPDTPGHGIPAATNFSGPPPLPAWHPRGSFGGYVQNWTAAKDPCLEPSIREYHGSFVEPVSIKTTRSLVPMFSGSKLPLNNDILIPAAMYWSNDPRFTVEEESGSWEKKKVRVMWRGGASGGRNRENNWSRFQRHRFVAMVNGTAARNAKSNKEKPGVGANFVLPAQEAYPLTATQYMSLGKWLAHVADVGIVHLTCFPATGGPFCPYTDDYFKVVDEMQLKDQLAYKFLPDIDGNSFSGRYRTFLLSSSLPIKATIYSEWHDSRLMPWVHFVPMDNSFVDIYGILDYFIGTKLPFMKGGQSVVPGAHDDEAEKIALQGKEWAQKVLRKEDMAIYYMRLLMEYARVCDDQRARLGYVDDLR